MAMAKLDRPRNLRDLEAAVGHDFRNPALVKQAFVHRSYLNENPALVLPSNERLEFLGDAVLGFVAAEWLYRDFPELPEGDLTRLRASLVRAETLARAARRLGLGQYVLLSRGEESSGGRDRQGLLAATFESLLGAILLDLGLEPVRHVVHKLLGPDLARVLAEDTAKDYKSRLQELAQASLQVTPAYRTLAAEGPDHERTFTVEVLVGTRAVGTGRGRSKQAAEQEAARHALEQWDGRGVEGG